MYVQTQTLIFSHLKINPTIFLLYTCILFCGTFVINNIASWRLKVFLSSGSIQWGIIVDLTSAHGEERLSNLVVYVKSNGKIRREVLKRKNEHLQKYIHKKFTKRNNLRFIWTIISMLQNPQWDDKPPNKQTNKQTPIIHTLEIPSNTWEIRKWDTCITNSKYYFRHA